MRFLVLNFLVLLCYLYGLAFDLALESLAAGLLCDSIRPAACFLPAAVDLWLSRIVMLILLPAAGMYTVRLVAGRPRQIARAASLFCILMVAP
jgi:hypothetical protein